MDIQTVNKKVFSGFVTLTFRRFLLSGINYLSIYIVLASVLEPAVLGIFNIALAILTFFTYFSDVGLAAALIQKKEISKEDLRTTFTIQESLAFLISLIVIIFAPQFAQFYNLDEQGMWLIRALGFSFFLTSLKVIPAVLLERELNFGKLVWVEVLETVAFNGVLIFLVFEGFNVSSFTWAALTRSLIGAALINILSPWSIGFGFSKSALRALVNFGVPFQINSFLALLKDRLVPLVIARMVGPTGVGYITWAQGITYMPFEVMNNMSRVSFPAFARLQDDKEALGKMLDRTVFLTTLMLYPLLFGILAIAPSLVSHILTNKWGPALPMIYLIAINVFLSAISTPLTHFLNATGKINTTLKLMVMWTALEWLLSPLLTLKFGYYGVPITLAIVGFTALIPIFIVKRDVNIHIVENTFSQVIASVVMALVVFGLSVFFVRDILTMLVAIAIGGLLYIGLMFVMSKSKIMEYYKSLRYG